jgi:phytanoyl-CoA hydroxylase
MRQNARVHSAEWNEQGWLHLRGFFSREEVAAVNGAVERLWATRPRGVTVDDLDTNRRCRMSALDDSARQHRLKLNDLYLVSPELRDALLAPRLAALLRSLLDAPPVLCNSLNLERSSEQDNHIDSLYMTPLSVGQLVATWIALEDIRADAGPLRVYPGSHRITPYRFSDGGRHALDAEMDRWSGHTHDEVRRLGLQPVTVPAAAGDLVVWHADLLHGAEAIADPRTTRKSVVGHYFSLEDSRRRGYRLEPHGDAWWIARRPQPVDAATRVLSAIERRVQRLRARFR